MTKFIDAKGKTCPIPVIMTRQALSEGADQLTIEVDNNIAVENLKRLASNLGFTVSVQPVSGGFSVSLSKSGEPCPACEEAVNAPLPTRTGTWSVFVGNDIIGDGDRELGANLIRMFFYTLAQSDDLPRTVLFMNAGVKLPAGDAQVAEHLAALQSRGVEVLVCGTCLNFYGLSDQLMTGTVSNMFDILTAMQTADKVITL